MTEEVSRPKTCVGCITGADCVCSEQAVTCERKQQLWDSGYAFCSRSMKRAALLLAAEAVQDKRHEAERAAGNPDILPGEITRLLLEAVVKQFRLAEEDLRSRAELALPVTTEPHMHTPVIGNLLDRTIGPTSINDVCACGATRRFYLDVDGRWEACAWVEPTPAACPDCGAIGCTGSILAEPEPEPVVLRAGEASSTDGGKTWLHDKSGKRLDSVQRPLSAGTDDLTFTNRRTLDRRSAMAEFRSVNAVPVEASSVASGQNGLVGVMTDPFGLKDRSEEEDEAALQRFVDLMRTKLRANRHKAHWDSVSVVYLRERVNEELVELDMATSWVEARLECADAANFLMMISDKLFRAIE